MYRQTLQVIMRVKISVEDFV